MARFYTKKRRFKTYPIKMTLLFEKINDKLNLPETEKKRTFIYNKFIYI